MYIRHLFPLLSQFKNRYSKNKHTGDARSITLSHSLSPIHVARFEYFFDRAYFHKQYFNMNLAFFDISLK